MIEKLERIKKRFEVVGELLIKPETLADMKLYSKFGKEYKELEKIVIKFEEYKNVLNNIQSAKQVLETEKDSEFREMAKHELETLSPIRDKIEEQLKDMLIPKDPNDGKNVILEIRAGTGGDEAALFAGDLFRMYQRFCEKKAWKLSVLDLTEGPSGGYKEIISTIIGESAYGLLKYESGIHRVQRVPVTETQGRVHTSAASVAVLPEVEEVEVELNMSDIRRDTFCSSGPGGQSVNTTYSAIRLTHIPTGIVVTCQDEKSQIKNFDKALKVLRSRLYEMEIKKINDEIGEQRKLMVGSGDRSDKIRTYNYSQSRVTDHRINYSVYNLATVLNGEIEDFIEHLRIADNSQKLNEGESSQ